MRPKFFRTAPALSECRLEADRQSEGGWLKESREQLIKRSRECARQPKTEQGKTHQKTTFLLHVRRGKKGSDNSFDEGPPVASLGAVSFILPLKGHIRPTKHARGSRRTLHVADIVNRFFCCSVTICLHAHHPRTECRKTGAMHYLEGEFPRD